MNVEKLINDIQTNVCTESNGLFVSTDKWRVVEIA